jgi:hypothetical protein
VDDIWGWATQVDRAGAQEARWEMLAAMMVDEEGRLAVEGDRRAAAQHDLLAQDRRGRSFDVLKEWSLTNPIRCAAPTTPNWPA